MSDDTPLIRINSNSNIRKYSEDESEYYLDQDDDLSHYGLFTKFIAYVLCIILGLGTLYFFTIFLPDTFIPESTDLVGIQKISNINVYLNPISQERVSELQMGVKNVGSPEQYDEYENENEQDYQSITDSKLKPVERIILIGDIHGHYTQFRKLLSSINYKKETDHLIVLGDFITKGPDSSKVLDYLIANDIDCILGNHEYYVLQNYALFHNLDQPFFVIPQENNDISLAESYEFKIKDNFNSDPEYILARKLQPEHVKYINHCSVIKHLGDVPVVKSKSTSFAPGIAVHAGIRWDLELNEQDPEDNLEMRSYLGPYFNETTSDPSEEDAISWSKIFNMKQKERASNGDNTLVVYYGHDAHRGLNIKRYAKGIDSGCDAGKQLTAMVIWKESHISKKGKENILFKEKSFQVQC
ncbi:Metallo-dependent phosphatase-like protein [Scheffersomyces amazonensis]|uniref:Metallo-dependent phosphatase-like protein n=1 Tax=Scheffersomyces amazonensis TaxID=1078765 RepID=UPI00315D0F63